MLSSIFIPKIPGATPQHCDLIAAQYRTATQPRRKISNHAGTSHALEVEEPFSHEVNTEEPFHFSASVEFSRYRIRRGSLVLIPNKTSDPQKQQRNVPNPDNCILEILQAFEINNLQHLQFPPLI